MRILFLLALFVMMTIMASAQNRGGEVSRKPNTERNRSQKRQNAVHNNTSIPYKGISRNLDGAILGKSTKQEIISHAKSKHLSCQFVESGNCLMASGDYTFGGISWSSVEYRFYKNVLWQVVFSKTGNGPSGSTIVFDYSNLRDGLLRKYKDYYSPIFSDDLSFSDNHTYIAVFGGKPEVNQKLQLRYTDAFILKKINEGRNNDL